MTHHADTTSNQIIKETIKQISENGYENISLRQLASNIGLTTGAFYKNFNSKEALFEKVTSTLSNQLSDELAAHLDSKSSPQSQLLNMADQLTQKFQSDANTMNFLFFNPTAAKLLNEPGTAESFGFYRLVTSIINQLKLTSPQIDSRVLFIQIWSFIQGYGLLIVNHVTTYDPVLVASTLAEFLKV